MWLAPVPACGLVASARRVGSSAARSQCRRIGRGSWGTVAVDYRDDTFAKASFTTRTLSTTRVPSRSTKHGNHGVLLPGLVALAGATAISLTACTPGMTYSLCWGGIGGTGGVSRSKSSTSTLQSSGDIIDLAEPVKLYQYASCPFCNKAQAFMEFHGVAYDKVEVNPLSKEQIKFSSYKMVPLALVNGEQINGSGAIINALLGGETVVAAKRTEDEKQWITWVDDHLVHLLPPNIYRNPLEALQAFDYITNNSGDFTFVQRLAIRYAGAAIMFLVAKRAKKKYNLSDDPRQDLREACELWATEALSGGSRQFHGGDHVDDADLAVFGVLRSIDGNYQTWEDLRVADFGHKEHFWGWFDSVKAQVAANKIRQE